MSKKKKATLVCFHRHYSCCFCRLGSRDRYRDLRHHLLFDLQCDRGDFHQRPDPCRRPLSLFLDHYGDRTDRQRRGVWTLGIKTFTFYIGTSLMAIMIGLFFVNIIAPGTRGIEHPAACGPRPAHPRDRRLLSNSFSRSSPRTSSMPFPKDRCSA